MTIDTSTPKANILSCLANLQKLRHLYFSDNPLNTNLWISFSNLSTSLQVLDLGNCGLRGNLSGLIPSDTGNLSSLILLDLHVNQLSGPIPSSIGRLHNLQVLYMHENILQGFIPDELCQLKNLVHLWLIGRKSADWFCTFMLGQSNSISKKSTLRVQFVEFHNTMITIYLVGTYIYLADKLEKLLYSSSLNILQRLDIMIDVASALIEYLHYGYEVPIVHCDLKPSNILLDDDMVAHVADFGISKLLGGRDSMTHTMTLATTGYIAPEYGMEGIVSRRGDVYSFGIVVMEIFTRRKPTDEVFTADMRLDQWVASFVDADSIALVVEATLLGTY